MSDSDNFSPEQLLKKAIASLEQPDKFAEIFCQAARKQKAIDDVLQEVMRKLIEHDAPIRDALKGLLKEADKEERRSFFRKIRTQAWAILLLVVGAFLQWVSRKIIYP